MPQHAIDLSLHGTRSFEPPYDDEAGGPLSPSPMTSGALALAMPLVTTPAEAPTLRLLTGGRVKLATEPVVTPGAEPTDPDEAVDEDAVFLTQRTPRRDLPPPRAFGARLVQALSEATAGERPLTQLSPHLTGQVYARLERQFANTVRGTGSAGQDNRANVRSVRVCEPSDGVAEVAAVVRRGARMAAVALRLEGIDGRWQCTALQIG